MTTSVDNRAFVDELLGQIIRPGVEQLMASRYFVALRSGDLTIRQLQGFSIQHFVHNMGVLKAAALGAVQYAANDNLFKSIAGILIDEYTHPDICKKFGFALGLTDTDFDNAIPAYGCRAHTAATVHGIFLATPVEQLANALTNETMVQRYAEEFDDYLRKNYPQIPEDALEFFVLHRGADIEHTERSITAIAAMAASQAEQERVRAVCRDMVRFKVGKFDSIYEAYA